MNRFQRFLNRQVHLDTVYDEALISSLNIESRYVPEEIDTFEELEFGLGQWNGLSVIFTLVLEDHCLKRISLGFIPQGGDEDDMRAFSAEQLQVLLKDKEKDLNRFLTAVFPK